MYCGAHVCSLWLNASVTNVLSLVYCTSVFSGFAGSNAIQNLELFSIVDAAADAWVHVYDANFHEKNEELKV